MRAKKSRGKRIIGHKQATKRVDGVKEETKSRYRRIVEAMTEGIWEIDAQSRTTYVNRRMADLLGYTPEEMLGQPAHHFLLEEDLEDHRAKMTARQGGDHNKYERRFRRKDGKTLWTIVSPTALKDKRGRFAGSFALISDITDRKQAEEALRFSEERFRLFMDNSPAVAWVKDDQGRYVYVNKPYEKLVGMRWEDLLGTSDFDLWPPEAAKQFRKNDQAALESNRPVEMEEDVLQADGILHHGLTIKFGFRDGTEKPYVAGISLDITERKQFEEALKKNQDRLARINDLLLTLGPDHAANLTRLTALAGELMGGACALYNRLQGGLLCSLGQWQTPPDFQASDTPEGHICYDVIRSNGDEAVLIRNLQQTSYARSDPNVRAYGLQTYFGQVVRCEGRPVGSLCVVFHKDCQPSDEDRRVLGILASAIGNEDRRWQAEEALRISEKKFSAAFHANSVLMAISAVKDGVFLDVNHEFLERLGYRREEVIGKSSVDLKIFPPSVRTALVETLAKQGSARNVEVVVYAKDGTTLHGLFSGDRIEADGQPCWLTVVVDITERKRVELELAHSREQLRLAIDGSGAGLWDWNVQTGGVVVNDRWAKIIGYDLQELEPLNIQTWIQHCHPDDLIKSNEALDRHFRGETTAYECEARMRHKTGQWVWVLDQGKVVEWDQDGKPLRMTGTHLDISDRKKTEEALRQSEESYRRLAEDMPVYISAFLPGGTLNYVNPALAAMAGQLPDQMIGRNFLDLLTPTDRQTVVTRLASLSPAHPTETHEQTHVALDGAVRWQQWTNRAFFDQNGRVDHFQAVGLDITDRKLAGNRLLQLNEELEQRVRERTAKLQETNKELEAFAYSVSHDLRGPLRTIAGFSQLLTTEYAEKLGEQGKQDLKRIQGAAFKMSQLIDDLLTLSRLTRQEMKIERLDLSRVVGEIAAELSLSAPTRPVEFVVAPGVATQGDGQLLRLVLQNLLDNAWKFTRKEKQARIEFGVEEREGQQYFYVRDNGVGFDMAFANKLFGAFQRLHREDEFEGLGIGLATVQRIIHRHGGKVWAEGEPNKGATFYFTLPEGS